MPLKEYRSKRDFKTTSEPEASTSGGKADGLIYVIQKHDASHLHYDLRLEQDGVLRSWAVPKPPVNKPGLKRLAVPVEDHPLGYESFEGSIPVGQYGAGTVEIWDSGRYEPLERSEDKLIVRIKGRRLSGDFALIRIKDRKSAKPVWLFFKLGQGPGESVERGPSDGE